MWQTLDELEASRPRELPTFKGWTIDARLREFRKMHPLRFVPFNSPDGKRLLAQLAAAGYERLAR